MLDELKQDRRRFLGSAAMSSAAAQLGVTGSTKAQSSKANPVDRSKAKPGASTSFGSVKQIDAGLLNVGYAEAGPVDGSPVILLHGWPYDIHSFVDVAPLLASKAYRVIVPHLPGYAPPLFLSAQTLPH